MGEDETANGRGDVKQRRAASSSVDQLGGARSADRLVPDVAAAAGDLVTDATPRAFRRTRRQTTKQLHCKQILQEGEGDNVDPSVGAM